VGGTAAKAPLPKGSSPPRATCTTADCLTSACRAVWIKLRAGARLVWPCVNSLLRRSMLSMLQGCASQSVRNIAKHSADCSRSSDGNNLRTPRE